MSGAAGKLRRGDIETSPLTEAGFDEDLHFVLVEITGDEMHFQAISRTGVTIDAGVFSDRVSRGDGGSCAVSGAKRTDWMAPVTVALRQEDGGEIEVVGIRRPRRLRPEHAGE